MVDRDAATDNHPGWRKDAAGTARRRPTAWSRVRRCERRGVRRTAQDPITHREAIVDCILREDVTRPAAIARLFGRVNEGRPRCRIRVPADRSWPPVVLGARCLGPVGLLPKDGGVAPQAALAERCARRRDSSSSFLAFGFAMSSASCVSASSVSFSSVKVSSRRPAASFIPSCPAHAFRAP